MVISREQIGVEATYDGIDLRSLEERAVVHVMRADGALCGKQESVVPLPRARWDHMPPGVRCPRCMVSRRLQDL